MRLRPFFCPCTVDVSHLKLGVADDGSLHRLGENAVAIESSDDDVDIDDYDFESDEDAGHLTEVSDSAGSRIGKIKAIKRLGGFYLSAGGGIDRSWNGQGFPGYRVLVPALRSCSAVNSGVTTSHHVRFWPSLKPVTHQQTGFPTDATMAGALRDMSRTSEEALVHPRRFGALSIPELADQYHSLKSDLQAQEDADNARLDRADRGEYEQGVGDSPEISAGNLPDDEACDVLEDDTNATAQTTVDDADAEIRRSGDSMSGQSVHELAGRSQRPTFGFSTNAEGKRVKIRLLDTDERNRILQLAVSRGKQCRFHFNPHHIKRGESGPRYDIYKGICNWDDYKRENSQRMRDTGANVVTMEDLEFDVERKILTFSYDDTMIVTDSPFSDNSTVLYIDDGQEDCLRSVVCKKPRYHCPDQKDVMADLYFSARTDDDSTFTANCLLLLSNAEFRVVQEDDKGGEAYVKVKNLREAMESDDWEAKWLPAIRKEISGLEERQVWKRVPRHAVPHGTRVLPSHLVFDIKYDASGVYQKHKCRMVQNGARSSYGVHYFESSSQVMTSTSMKLMAGLSVGEWGLAVEEARASGCKDISHLDHLKMHSIDISQAFTVVDVSPDDPPVYMELPNLTPGDRTRNEYVALMQKMLYGGKSASRSWQQYVDTFLRDRFDAVPLVADCCVYKIQIDGETLIAGVFVDDISFFSSSASLNQRFISEFKEHFGDTKVTGGTVVDSLLGIKFEYDDDDLTLKLSMPGYLTKLAKEFGLENAKPTATSLPIDVVDKKNDGPVDHDRRELFQRMVGGLQWCAQQCLPWISKGVHQLSRHTHNPSEEHIKLAKHCIRHTQKDITRGLVFHGSSKVLGSPWERRFKLVSYCDANLDGDSESEHSLGCIVIQFNGAPIMMKVLKQTRIARSTGHSEMQTLCLLGQALMFCTDWLNEMGYSQETTTVYEDNSACVLQSSGDHQSSKSAHYRRDQASVEELVRAGKMWVQHCPSHLNIADIGTKIVKPVAQYEFLQDRLTGTDPTLPMGVKMQRALANVFSGYQ